MSPHTIWAAWFAAIAVPGTAAEVGLQTVLGLPLGYGFAFILFVLAIAVAIAEMQEFLFEASDEHDRVLEILTSEDGVENLQGDIDQELNGQ